MNQSFSAVPLRISTEYNSRFSSGLISMTTRAAIADTHHLAAIEGHAIYRTLRVTRCGRICLGSCMINLRVANDLGYFDRDQDQFEPGPNPLAPDEVLTMCSECTKLMYRLRDSGRQSEL